jgi:translation initiation factor IF-2
MNNMPPPAGTDGTRRRREGGGPKRDNAEKDRGTQRSQTRRRQVIDRDELYQGMSRGKRGRKRKVARKGAKTLITTPAAHKRIIGIDETISVGELGKGLGVKVNELIAKLMQMGLMVTINQQIDIETASLLATEYDYEVKNVAFAEDEILSGPVDDTELADDPDAVSRAPVVTIMGHVDHGKTTLLDQIRSANVAGGEAGGITQHIGAYKVVVNDSEVVFLDTPGHAAFTAMRARGASVTDIIVLIVAADDGVMPQTVESINHAKAANVPLVVAVNKCDKPDVDPERIKQELTQYELVPEEWGGDTMFVNVSALTGMGVENLVEALGLQSEVLELKANPSKPAYGHIVEARVEKGRGNVCTVLVQEGTLKKGDFIVSGSHYGRVRSMTGDTGSVLTEAGPSTPIEVTGLGGMPGAGDGFHVVASEKDAKRVVSSRTDKQRTKPAEGPKEPVDPMELLAAFGLPDKEKQNVILKADVAGSYEAIRVAIEQLATDEVEVRLLHGGVGPVTQSDVDLAVASDAAILVFNTSIDSKAKRTIDQSNAQVFKYSVIYELIDGVRELMSGLLSPERVEEYLGRAEVRAVFHIQKVGSVAGCMVVDGKMVRNMFAKVMRGGEAIYTGKLTTLKRVKDDAREVVSGMECGLTVEGYKDIQVGDLVEVYEVTDVRRTIE